MASKQKLKRRLRRRRLETNDLRIALEAALYRAHFAELKGEQLAKENIILRKQIDDFESQAQWQEDITQEANNTETYLSEVV